ncbi:MAG TPA: hypothetical protein VFP05_17220 [Thermomicrobiales bacterium]|nr:hypothetical protein [Thermomicrobiales bacterium]
MWRVLCGFVFCFLLIASSLTGVSPALAQTSTPTTATPAEESDVSGWEPITEPWVDPDDTLGDAFFVSLESDPVASEIEGTTQLQPDEYKLLPADVALTDFYAELYYLTPALPEGGEFSVGFCFWVDANGGCYDIVIQVDTEGNAIVGSGFMPAVGQGDYRAMTMTTTLAAPQMDPTPGAENTLSVVVYDGYAILSGNDFDVIAMVALPDDALAGKVKAQIGFVDWGLAANTPPLSVTITDLEVWDLSSGMTPIYDWLDEPAATPAPGKPLGTEATDPGR